MQVIAGSDVSEVISVIVYLLLEVVEMCLATDHLKRCRLLPTCLELWPFVAVLALAVVFVSEVAHATTIRDKRTTEQAPCPSTTNCFCSHWKH